jgi:hypothetical protein
MNVGGDVLVARNPLHKSQRFKVAVIRPDRKTEQTLFHVTALNSSLALSLALDLLIDDARHFRSSATNLSVGSILIGEPNGFLSRSHC